MNPPTINGLTYGQSALAFLYACRRRLPYEDVREIDVEIDLVKILLQQATGELCTRYTGRESWARAAVDIQDVRSLCDSWIALGSRTARKLRDDPWANEELGRQACGPIPQAAWSCNWYHERVLNLHP